MITSTLCSYTSFLCTFVQLLLYVIDSAGGDKGGSGGNEPASDLRALWKELKLYDEDLLNKPALIFANKSDLHCKLNIYSVCFCII